jgi:hypothetical protein
MYSSGAKTISAPNDEALFNMKSVPTNNKSNQLMLRHLPAGQTCKQLPGHRKHHLHAKYTFDVHASAPTREGLETALRAALIHSEYY